jgi:glycosyltransferase involved in cell wall biosynthesis
VTAAFSVLIAAYNSEDTIAETLESLIAQTCGDWEAVVADDGSTDATAKVVAGYAARDPRITLVTKPNGGTGSARNAAASHARAPLWSLLDADDAYLPEYFERIGRFIGEHPSYDIYSSDGYVFTTGEPPIEDDLQSDSVIRSYTVDDLIVRNRFRVLTTFRRDVFDLVGGFDEDRRMAMEDYDFWLRALLAGARHIHDPERLWKYRMSASQKTNDPCVGLRADLHMFEGLLESGRLDGARLGVARARCRQLRRDVSILEGRKLRAEFEGRLASGDFRGARTAYVAARRGYGSAAKFSLGLLVLIASPRAFAWMSGAAARPAAARPRD